MAYGKKYTSRFRNRLQTDYYRIEIWEKDYEDSPIELTSGESGVFTINWPNGDTNLLEPIKSSEATFSIMISPNEFVPFYSGNADINIFLTHRIDIYNQTGTNGVMAGMYVTIAGTPYNIESVLYSESTDILTLIVTENVLDDFLPNEDFTFYSQLGIESFYSDDDEKYRVDFYYEGSPEKLIWTGFLVQDGATEELTDTRHYIVLKATDNLGILKQTTWDNSATLSVDGVVNGQGSLYRMVQDIIDTTGLDIPVNVWANVYENTTDDRSDLDTAEPFSETIIFFSTFKNSDGTWQNCYDILSTILSTFNACIFQAVGEWHIIRISEYKLFDGAIPGTYRFGFTSDAVTLSPFVLIGRTSNDASPVAEDQIKQMQRSMKYVQSTFNYEQPELIIQNDLSLPPGAVPYDTNTVDGIRTDFYDIATYFPYWVSRNGDASHLRVLTDTNVDPEQEIDRYIHKPADFDIKNGLQFNPISVSQNDKIDFSFQFNNQHADGYYFVRYILITDDGNVYSLDMEAPSVGTNVSWTGPFTTSDWYSEPVGVRIEKEGVANEWFNYTLSQFNDNKPFIIPADGMLLIEMDGNSSDVDGGFGTYQTDFKDMNLTITSFVNESTQIIGHTHKDELSNLSKLVQENELQIDDSPRNSIAGTLFTDALTNFDYTDTDTSEETDIGDVYFTRTHAWHRGEVSEALRLGNITTEERLFLQYTSRLIIEGTFRNVRYDTDKFISPLSLFNFDFYMSKYFIAASMEIDYMQCVFKTRLIEIYQDEDSMNDTYTFNYIYDTQQ